MFRPQNRMDWRSRGKKRSQISKVSAVVLEEWCRSDLHGRILGIVTTVWCERFVNRVVEEEGRVRNRR